MSDACIVYTDGACVGNPGPGGWGFVALLPNDQVFESGDGSKKTTNNRMELQAVLSTLKFLHEENLTKADVFSDSQYVVKGMNEWVKGWIKRGWRKSDGGPVANLELWQAIEEQRLGLELRMRHVAAHVGIPGNERADKIAEAFARGSSPELYRGVLDAYRMTRSQFSRSC